MYTIEEAIFIDLTSYFLVKWSNFQGGGGGYKYKGWNVPLSSQLLNEHCT